MNITRESRGELTSLLRVTVGQSDYGPAVENKLREYKRKANVPGFRPGMVPIGIVKKMYGKGVLAEEAYRTASDACFDYIRTEKIDYIGDLMPSDEQPALDFDKEGDFEFAFELGEAPTVDIELSAADKVTRYTITPSAEMLSGYRSSFLRKYGRLVDVDTVTSDEAITGTLDNDAMNVEDAYVGLISMTDPERAPFIGKKVGDTMEVDVNVLYKNPSQRASILQLKQDELDSIDPKFTLTIKQIRKFADPDMNDEFFGMAFPDGGVKDEAGLDAHIASQVAGELKGESDYLFASDVRRLLIDKAALKMPAEFLKRWLHAVNEGKFTMDEIEKDFDAFLDMMRWNIVQKHLVAKFDIQVGKDDLMQEAKNLTLAQFSQYGMTSLPDDMLSNYAEQMLRNKEEANKILERLYERRVVEAVTPIVGVKEKSVSPDEFGKIVEKRR